MQVRILPGVLMVWRIIEITFIVAGLLFAAYSVNQDSDARKDRDWALERLRVCHERGLRNKSLK